MSFKKHKLSQIAVSMTLAWMGFHAPSLLADVEAIANAGATSGNMEKMPSSQLPYYYNQDSHEFFVYAEWIYWKPVTEDPMNWVKTQLSKNTANPQIFNDHFDSKSLKYDYSSGFRVGGGYRFARDTLEKNIRPWQIETEYTRLHTAESSHEKVPGLISSDGNTVTFEVLDGELPAFLYGNFIEAHTRASLEYDRLDVKFAWPIWMRSNVILRLMTGATFAWFENDWKTQFSNKDYQPHPFQKTDLEWKWWGGGLMGGGDIYMAIGKGLGFFVDSSFGLLFGPTQQEETYFSSSDQDATHETETKLHPYQFQPVVNFGAGVDYKHWFKDKVMLHLALGWEFTWWFGMNQFGRVNDRSQVNPIPNVYFLSTEPTDLGFQGLTARLGFDF